MDNKCSTSSSSLVEGIKNCPNFGTNCDCDYCHTHALEQSCKSGDGQCTAFNGNCESAIANSASATKLSDVFPSLLTAEDKKPSPPPPEKLPPQPPLVQDLVKDLDEHMTIVNDTDKVVETTGDKNTQPKDKPKEKSPLQRDSETPPPAPVSESKEKHDCCKDNDCPSTESGASPSVPSKNATTAKELRDLMYRHYCVGKGKLKKPSANAIKKGKVPPPTCSTLNQNQNKPHQHCTKGGHTDSDTEELSEEDDDGSDDTSSETSKATTTTASESHNKNGSHCNCCYCEVFGPGGQSVAPVSRNYPEMRERLRLLLSKKKRKNQQKPPPPPPKKQADQQHSCGSHQGHGHGHSHQHGHQHHHQTNNRASSASSSASSNVRSRQSESRSKSKESPAPALPVNTNVEEVKDEKALDELLDFIEGNQKSSNEKKRAKKERQKLQKF